GGSSGAQPTRRDFTSKAAVRSLAVFPAVIALIAGPTLAAAQAPPANTVIYACVKDPDGDGDGRLVRIVGINEPCKRRETRVSWSVVGPQGPKGDPGPVGPVGP